MNQKRLNELQATGLLMSAKIVVPEKDKTEAMQYFTETGNVLPSPMGLATESLLAAGVKYPSIENKVEYLMATFTRPSMQSDPLGEVLFGAVNRTITLGMETSGASYPMVTSQESVNDFRDYQRARLFGFAPLREVPQGEAVNVESVTSEIETGAVETYGLSWVFSRASLINNNFSGLFRRIQQSGAAISRTVDKTVWALLESNPTMSDGESLFSSAHANLAASGAAFSTGTLATACSAVSSQVVGSDISSLMPSKLILPSGKRGAYESILSTLSQAGTGLETVYAPRLTDSDAWYLAVSPELMPGLIVLTLAGSERPAVLISTGKAGTYDGLAFQFTYEFGVMAADYRPLYKNAGA